MWSWPLKRKLWCFLSSSGGRFLLKTQRTVKSYVVDMLASLGGHCGGVDMWILCGEWSIVRSHHGGMLC